MFYDWEKEYLINVESVDFEHQKIFLMVKVLHEYMEKGESHVVMENFVNELIKYTETHFLNEEKLMKEKGVPKAYYAGQVQQHKDLIKQVEICKADFETKGDLCLPQITTFLVDWLKNHIARTDKKLYSFFN